MPSILTCLVGRWLCKQPTENHWELRYEAARLTLIRELYRDTHHIIDVATITIITVIIRLNWWLPFAPSMRSNTPSRPRSSHKNKTLTLDERYAKYRFGGAYQNLQPRVTKTLLHAFLDPKKPLTTHYGAIVGLSKLVRPRRLFASLVQLHIPSLPHSLTHHYRSGPKCHSSAAVAQHWLVRAHVDADSPGARGCHQATRGTKVSRRFVGTTAKPNIHRSIFEYSPCSLFIHWDLSVVASCRYLFATSA